MQSESSVEIDISPQSSNLSKNENSESNRKETDEIAIQSDGQSTSKLQQKHPESLFITSSYTFSTLALVFIAIAMSAVVLTSPGTRKSTVSLSELADMFDDDTSQQIDTEDEYEKKDDVNSSYINPEQAKYEYIHGQLKDLSICLVLFNISDLNGACLVHNPKNFMDASEVCISHNMTLLEMNSEHEKMRVFEETEKIFGTGGGTRIWMNGKFSKNENAFLSHPKNVKFYITNDQIDPSSRRFGDGVCLAVESFYHGRYHIAACPCGGEHYFYCEF